MVREAHEDLAGRSIPDEQFKYQVWHRLRNWLKHAKKDADSTMTFRKEDAVRALLAGIGAYDELTREQRPDAFNRFANDWHSIRFEFSGVSPPIAVSLRPKQTRQGRKVGPQDPRASRRFGYPPLARRRESPRQQRPSRYGPTLGRGRAALDARANELVVSYRAQLSAN